MNWFNSISELSGNISYTIFLILLYMVSTLGFSITNIVLSDSSFCLRNTELYSRNFDDVTILLLFYFNVAVGAILSTNKLSFG
jgi:hypothetical protein